MQDAVGTLSRLALQTLACLALVVLAYGGTPRPETIAAAARPVAFEMRDMRLDGSAAP